MPRLIQTWVCKVCGSHHDEIDDAYACESNHRIDAAAERTKAKIAEALKARTAAKDR